MQSLVWSKLNWKLSLQKCKYKHIDQRLQISIINNNRLIPEEKKEKEVSQWQIIGARLILLKQKRGWETEREQGGIIQEEISTSITVAVQT